MEVNLFLFFVVPWRDLPEQSSQCGVQGLVVQTKAEETVVQDTRIAPAPLQAGWLPSNKKILTTRASLLVTSASCLLKSDEPIAVVLQLWAFFRSGSSASSPSSATCGLNFQSVAGFRFKFSHDSATKQFNSWQHCDIKIVQISRNQIIKAAGGAYLKKRSHYLFGS